MLKELKHACECVLFLLKLQAMNLFTGITEVNEFTKVNELKNIYKTVYKFMFFIFQMQIFHIYKLKSKR